MIMPALFFLLGLYSYVIYPAWYLPVADSVKLVWMNLLIFVILGLTRVFYLILKSQPAVQEEKEADKFRLKDGMPYVIISVICILLHLIQINYPILTGLDSHLHTGLPAVLVSKINQSLAQYTAGFFNIHVISWIVVLSIFIFLKWKKNPAEKIARLKMDKRGLILFFVALIVLSNLYGIIIIKSRVLEMLGDISLIHRYPALGKSLYFAGYGLFGIHEWVGRLIDITFTLAGGFLLSRIAQFYTKEKMFSLGVYALYIFLPPIFNILYSDHLAAGTVFFFIAVHFCFLRYLHIPSAKETGILIMVLSCGFMFKQIFLACVFMLWLYFLLMNNGKSRKLSAKVMDAFRITAVPFIFAMPNLVVDFLINSSPKSFLEVEKVFHPMKFAINFLTLPFAITLPVFFIFSIVLLFSLFKTREQSVRLFLLWFFSYYIFTISAAFTYQRNMLPFYPAIILLCAIFLYEVSGIFSSWRRHIFYLSCSVILILFIHLGLFKEDTEFVTLSNNKYYLLPYDEAIGYLKKRSDRIDRVYAPMICEPSHFYLAKYGIVDRVYYFRKIWKEYNEQDFDTLYEFCKENKFDCLIFPKPGVKRHISYRDFYRKYSYLKIPHAGYTGGEWFLGKINERLIEDLFQNKDPRFSMLKNFKRGECELAIFSVL